MVQYMRPVKDSSEVAAGALGSYTLKSAFTATSVSSSQKAGALVFSLYHILLRTVSRNNQQERWRGREGQREGKRGKEQRDGGDYACHICLAINLTAACIPAHGLNQENIG